MGNPDNDMNHEMDVMNAAAEEVTRKETRWVRFE